MYSILSSNFLSILRISSFQNATIRNQHVCKILVVGGGTGGITMAAKLSDKFKSAPKHVILIEPNEFHYYQPLFTLVGAGITKFNSCRKLTKDLIPKNAEWIKDEVVTFDPCENRVTTKNGHTVCYELMIIAVGLEMYWNKIPGLIQALECTDSKICSIYTPETVTRVFEKIKSTEEGNAIFTYPQSLVKCPGAPQKIAYLSEHYWCSNYTRSNINVMYNTSLPVIFGVKQYATSLWNVCNSRSIKVNLCTNLVEVNHCKQEAVFQNTNKPDERCLVQFSLLHVTPPMGAPQALKRGKDLMDEHGYLNVHRNTLQHNKFTNIYGIGDCTNLPTSKTMAAIATQSDVLYKNLMANLCSRKMKGFYNGYTACPLVTAPGKCILAEFDYDLKSQETFPVNQEKELLFSYILKKYMFPLLYWNLMLKGFWNGPEIMRKIFSPLKMVQIYITKAQKKPKAVKK